MYIMYIYPLFDMFNMIFNTKSSGLFIKAAVLIVFLSSCFASVSAVTETTSTTTVLRLCNDSDGGLNYFVNGSVVWRLGGSGGSFTDFCLRDNVSLVEFYCVNRSASNVTFSCANVSSLCVNGACLCNTSFCNTSDGGDNISVMGTEIYYDVRNGSCQRIVVQDYCVNNVTLWEYVNCRSSGVRNCSFGCANGACVTTTIRATTIRAAPAGAFAGKSRLQSTWMLVGGLVVIVIVVVLLMRKGKAAK